VAHTSRFPELFRPVSVSETEGHPVGRHPSPRGVPARGPWTYSSSCTPAVTRTEGFVTSPAMAHSSTLIASRGRQGRPHSSSLMGCRARRLPLVGLLPCELVRVALSSRGGYPGMLIPLPYITHHLNQDIFLSRRIRASQHPSAPPIHPLIVTRAPGQGNPQGAGLLSLGPF
jgi:hypothetical protein